jgi:hypothetical protein
VAVRGASPVRQHAADLSLLVPQAPGRSPLVRATDAELLFG